MKDDDDIKPKGGSFLNGFGEEGAFRPAFNNDEDIFASKRKTERPEVKRQRKEEEQAEFITKEQLDSQK